MPKSLRVIALIAAYNEEDIVGQVVEALLNDGVKVYFIDNQSTDRTRERVQEYVDRGVIGIETFPPLEPGRPRAPWFTWMNILRRKEELASELDADWFIHHDADEFRESPWEGETLLDGIERVDAAGYNAIDFEVFDFRPTTADNVRLTDVRRRLQYFTPGRVFDRLQVKCWKKTGIRPDLVTYAGHDVQFEGRLVFPVRFLLRHYPIRSQQHGERKVLQDRLPRFDPEERARGWHVQYDDAAANPAFVQDPAKMRKFDPRLTRIDLFCRTREVEYWQESAESAKRDVEKMAAEATEARAHATADLQRLEEAIEALQAQTADLTRASAERDQAAAEQARALEAAHQTVLAGLRDETRRHRAELDDVKKELAAVAADLASRTSELAARNAELSARTTELDERRNHVAALEAELAERESELGRRARELSDLRDEQTQVIGSLARLRLQMETDSIVIDGLRADLETMRNEAASLRGAVADRDSRIAELSSQMQAAVHDLGRVTADVTRRDEAIARLMNSRSWRLTAPLRAADHLLRGDKK